MIILNEKEYAEECLRNKTLNDNPFFTLSILARYYYHNFGFRKKKIIELLTDFIQKYYPRYDCNKSTWSETIDKIAKNAGKYELHEIDGVWITKYELETISSIGNAELERLAFTMLCLAKLGDLRNPKNFGWVNNDVKEIFSLARINCRSSDRYFKICQLRDFLEFPKKINNLSCRVTFVNNDSEKILFISDFRELGYEYLKYCGENFVRCRECGVLIRNNKYGNRKYCSNCAGYIPQETKNVTCIDCGKEFIVPGNNKRTNRCDGCKSLHIKEYDRIRKTK